MKTTMMVMVLEEGKKQEEGEKEEIRNTKNDHVTHSNVTSWVT